MAKPQRSQQWCRQWCQWWCQWSGGFDQKWYFDSLTVTKRSLVNRRQPLHVQPVPVRCPVVGWVVPGYGVWWTWCGPSMVPVVWVRASLSHWIPTESPLGHSRVPPWPQPGPSLATAGSISGSNGSFSGQNGHFSGHIFDKFHEFSCFYPFSQFWHRRVDTADRSCTTPIQTQRKSQKMTFLTLFDTLFSWKCSMSECPKPLSKSRGKVQNVQNHWKTWKITVFTKITKFRHFSDPSSFCKIDVFVRIWPCLRLGVSKTNGSLCFSENDHFLDHFFDIFSWIFMFLPILVIFLKTPWGNLVLLKQWKSVKNHEKQ